MGTRAKIRIEAKGKALCAKYLGMDGHVENWAPTLITALNQTTPRALLESRQLLKFMFDDYERDDHLSYLCKVDISDEDYKNYKITIHGYDGRLLFVLAERLATHELELEHRLWEPTVPPTSVIPHHPRRQPGPQLGEEVTAGPEPSRRRCAVLSEICKFRKFETRESPFCVAAWHDATSRRAESLSSPRT